MPEDKAISDSSWTEKEYLLLRELLHHTQPGGLNQQDELSWPPELTWPEIVIRINELARERNISDRVYTKKCIKDRYFDYIKPYFSELVDEEKEGEMKA